MCAHCSPVEDPAEGREPRRTTERSRRVGCARLRGAAQRPVGGRAGGGQLITFTLSEPRMGSPE